MRAQLYRWRLEIKYTLAGVVALAGLYYLSHNGTLDGVQQRTIALLDHAAGYGLVGVFVGALIANLAVLISIPYTAITVTVALASNSLLEMVIICGTTGLGAGLGKIITYALTFNIASQQEKLAYSPLLNRIKATIETHPQAAPGLVFFSAASILPDDWVMVPLALVQYPVGKTIIPMLVGKVLHGLSLLFLVVLAVEPEDMAARSKADITLGILIVSLLVVFYQIERHLVRQRDAEATPPHPLDTTA